MRHEDNDATLISTVTMLDCPPRTVAGGMGSEGCVAARTGA
jgi:hypothetical protein